MDYETIILEKRGNIAVLTLNRQLRRTPRMFYHLLQGDEKGEL